MYIVVCIAISRLWIKCKSGLDNLGYYDVHCLNECELVYTQRFYFSHTLCLYLFIYINRKQVILNTYIYDSEVLSIWIKVAGGIYKTRCCFVKEVCDLRTLFMLVWENHDFLKENEM